MAHFLPNNEEKLLQINGVGQVKLEKYGARFLDLLATLRTNDFQEPIAKVKSSVQKLHTTYQTTLGLIEQDSSIENICQQRDLALTTVLSHINKLANSGRIEHSKRQQLFATIHTDEAINHWILKGLEQIDSIEKIQHHLAIFKQLNQID